MPRHLRLLSCLLLLGSCSIGHVSAQAHKTVVLLMSEELDGKGAVVPLRSEVVQLLQVLEQRSKLKFDIRRYPWKRALENAVNGEGLIFGISKTPERLRSLTFSLPMFADQSLLVTLCNSKFRFQSLDDLKGKTLGIVRGTSYGEEFDRLSNVWFKVEDDTGNNPGRFKKLSMGRMDAFLLYSSVADTSRLERHINEEYARESGNQPAGSKTFCILPKPVSSVDIHIAIRPDLDQGLIAQINQAILQARQPGQLEKI